MFEQQFSLPRGMKDIEPIEIARRIWLTDNDRRIDIVYYTLNPETLQRPIANWGLDLI